MRNLYGNPWRKEFSAIVYGGHMMWARSQDSIIFQLLWLLICHVNEFQCLFYTLFLVKRIKFLFLRTSLEVKMNYHAICKLIDFFFATKTFINGQMLYIKYRCMRVTWSKLAWTWHMISLSLLCFLECF